MTALPAWLEAELPAAQPPSVLSLEEGALTVTAPTGERETFEDLRAVRDGTNGVDLEIRPEVYEAYSEEGLEGFGLFFPVSEHFSGMLMSLTDEDRRGILVHAYEYFLEVAEAYRRDPQDFYNAYHFVDAHPAFWMKHEEGQTWHWETSNHCERVNQYVMKNDEGATVVALETGSHVPDTSPHGGPAAYTHHYHDYRLDTYAPTFEESFLQLAALVDKFFEDDGTEKADVPHEKPGWILDLEERVADFEEVHGPISKSE